MSRVKVEVVGVRLEYYQPRTDTRLLALDGVNFQIYEGEFLSIVGPSGCGKTTFLSIVDGLLAPTSGRIILEGKEIREPGPDRAVVFQDASLLPWRTVFKNVAYGLECRGFQPKEIRERTRYFIDMVGLSGFDHHYPHELSGGMQQRVNLARALVMDPQVLLMDEPFASLDAQTREVMQAELLSICTKANKTVLFITHQINEAVYLSDRVVVFTSRPGKVKRVVPIEIEQPRKLGIKRDPRFHQHEDYIWNLIEDEVKKTMIADRSTREGAAGGPRTGGLDI